MIKNECLYCKNELTWLSDFSSCDVDIDAEFDYLIQTWYCKKCNSDYIIHFSLKGVTDHEN